MLFDRLNQLMLWLIILKCESLIINIRCTLCSYQLVLCSILTGEVKVIASLSHHDDDELTSLRCRNNSLLTWSSRRWFVYTLDGALVNSGHVTSPGATILHADFALDNDLILLTSANDVTNTMTLELVSRDQARRLRMRGVVALSRDQRTVYTHSADNKAGCDVMCYTTNDVIAGSWSLVTKATLPNSETLYSLVFSSDEKFVIGALQTGFKRWHVATKRLVSLRLPAGVRNFPR